MLYRWGWKDSPTCQVPWGPSWGLQKRPRSQMELEAGPQPTRKGSDHPRCFSASPEEP